MFRFMFMPMFRRRAALFLLLACALGLLGARLAGAAEVRSEYGVVVAGGGMSGMAAALQAAKLGAGVLVVEPSDWIGGQATAAGVSTMDDLNTSRSGLYRDFIERIQRHYDRLGKSTATSYWNIHNFAFEPSVGQRVLYEMAEEVRSGGATLDILLRAEVKRVERVGNAVTGVTVASEDGAEREIKCRVLIDATEYGDVIPLAGAAYRAGNSVTPAVNPDAVIQDLTWVVILRRYPDGIPENLRVTAPLPGYPEAKKNYERYVTAKGGTFTGYPVRLPVDFVTHNAYRGLPDSSSRRSYNGRRRNWKFITKTSVNWGNDYPGQGLQIFPNGGLPVKYLEDRKFRARVEEEAFLKTLHFIYYVQNELKEPWSVADDEYAADWDLDLDKLPPAARPARNLPEEWREIARRMPPIPYVRESRRIVGDFTLTSAELYRSSRHHWDRESREFEDAIGTGRYGLDLHGAHKDSDMERDLGESAATIQTRQPREPFQVPLRILIPKEVDGLLAAEKNLSVTRQAAGALRVQPICMMTGQAAGALAAVSLRDGVPPREVPPVKVQRALLEAGVVLSLSRYSDVPPAHPFYSASQLSSLYGLLKPIIPPRSNLYSLVVPSQSSRNAAGIFGVDLPLMQGEAAVMLNKARAASKTSRGQDIDAIIADEDKMKAVTREMFFGAVSRAFGLGEREVFVFLNPGAAPKRAVTRGEAADVLMKAMTADFGSASK